MSIVTILNPIIGYEAAADIAYEYLNSDKSIREIFRARKILSENKLEKLFDLKKMTGLKKNL